MIMCIGDDYLIPFIPSLGGVDPGFPNQENQATCRKQRDVTVR